MARRGPLAVFVLWLSNAPVVAVDHRSGRCCAV